MARQYILSLFVGIALLLTGCSKQDMSKAGTPDNPYEIIWYNFGVDQKDQDIILKKVNDYIRPKLGVTLDFKTLSDYKKQINIIEASGESFDICFTASWVNNYRTAAAKGFIIPLNDLLKKYGQGILKEINPLLLKGTAIDGVNYAIPINSAIGIQHVFTFNKKYVDKYGFDLSKVKSMKDLEPMFKIIKEKEKGIDIYIPGQGYYFNDLDYLLAPEIPGAVWVKKGNHEVINQFKTKELIDRLKTIHSYFVKGYISADTILNEGNPERVKIGNWFCRDNSFSPDADKIFTRSYGFPVVSVPIYSPPLIGTVSLAGCMLAISSTSERPDLVMKFLNLLNTDKHLLGLLSYGIENTHYKKIDNNTIELLPRSKDYRRHPMTLGNVYNSYILSSESKNKFELMDKWTASSNVSQILGFTFNIEPVKNEVTAVQQVAAKYRIRLFYGELDPVTSIPKMLKEMKSAGSDLILAEMQKQLNEWWKKNK